MIEREREREREKEGREKRILIYLVGGWRLSIVSNSITHF